MVIAAVPSAPMLADIMVPPALVPWIERISWVAVPARRRIPLLAGARAHLLFRAAGSVLWSAPALTVEMRESMCWGPVTHPANVTAGADGMTGWLVKLGGGVAAAILGLPISEISERLLPLDALWPGLPLEPLDGSDAARERLVQLLQRSLDRFESRRLWSPQCCQRLMRQLDCHPVARVAASLGLSQSTLERRILHCFGLTPKKLARVQRLYRAMTLLGTMPDAQLASELDFFDQSHFIADFRQLCGMTPSALRQHSASEPAWTRLYRPH